MSMKPEALALLAVAGNTPDARRRLWPLLGGDRRPPNAALACAAALLKDGCRLTNRQVASVIQDALGITWAEPVKSASEHVRRGRTILAYLDRDDGYESTLQFARSLQGVGVSSAAPGLLRPYVGRAGDDRGPWCIRVDTPPLPSPPRPGVRLRRPGVIGVSRFVLMRANGRRRVAGNIR